MRARILLRLSLIVLPLLCLWLLGGCTEEIAKPVQTDRIEGAPEIPRNLATAVGDGQVNLSWSVTEPAKIARYIIYRGDTASSGPQIIDSTAQTSYVDEGLRNGLRYFYLVSAVNSSGLEGRLSNPVSATPNLFGVSINSGEKYTNSLEVTVSFAAPSGTRLVMLGNDPQFTGSQWANFTASRNWQLTSDDGVKTVYARFLDAENNEVLGTVSDEIILDTRAFIESVSENSAGEVLTVGDEIVFTLDAGELDGAASVSLGDIATIELLDVNPATADALADGVYHGLYTVPGGVDIANAGITGRFTDAAGNQAAPREATTLITIANPPLPSTLRAATFSESEIELTWTRSSASDFENYQIYRSETSTVNRNSRLIVTETNAGITNFHDEDLDPGKTYYYTLFTTDRSGLSAQSNVAQTATLANTVPDAVVLFVSDEDSLSVSLGWTPNTEDDFESYRVYRSATSPVSTTNNNNLVGVINSASTLNFTDNNIAVGEQFYYVVVVFDRFGARSVSSNEVRGPNP